MLNLIAAAYLAARGRRNGMIEYAVLVDFVDMRFAIIAFEVA
jgi:hypothetical protein